MTKEKIALPLLNGVAFIRLESEGFFGTHKSHIINLSYLQKYIKDDGGIAVMEDGSQIAVSRRNKGRFRNTFEAFMA